MKTRSKQMSRSQKIEFFCDTVDKMYALFGNEPQHDMSYKKCADLLEVPEHQMNELSILLKYINCMKIEITYPRGIRVGGRTSTWTLVGTNVTIKESIRAWEKLGYSFDATKWPGRVIRPLKKNRATTIEADAFVSNPIPTMNNEKVVAIVGEEPKTVFQTPDFAAMRKDEVGALIEATRQYKEREKVLGEEYTKLRELGFQMTWERFSQSFPIAKDERLEAVALLLPYISELENRIVALKRERDSLREDVRGKSDLLMQNNKLRSQVDRLIALKAAQ